MTNNTIDNSYRHIFAIALPVLLANLAMPIQGAIDTLIVGHFHSVYQLAGMGLAIQFIVVLLVSFNFLQYASSGLSAQTLGKYANVMADVRQRKLLAILQRALAMALLLGLIIMACQRWLIPLGLQLLGADNQNKIIAHQYLSVRIWGVIAELMNYAFLGWFAGQGRTKLMLYQQSFIACSNILLTLLFVYGFGMKIEGVALGTTLSYWLGMLLAMMLVCQHLNLGIKQFITIDRADFTLHKLSKLFALNRDIFIRTLLLTLSFAWITRLSAISGDIVLAVNTILLQVLMLSAYALDGLAVSTETLVGQYQGKLNQLNHLKTELTTKVARQRKQLIITLQRTCLASYLLALMLSCLWWLAMPYYLAMMTSLSEVYQLGYQYRWYAIVLPVIGVGAYWIDGVFFGMTAGKAIRNASIIVACLFFPLSWYLFSRYQMVGIWFSIWLLLLLRFVVLLIYSQRTIFVLPLVNVSQTHSK